LYQMLVETTQLKLVLNPPRVRFRSQFQYMIVNNRRILVDCHHPDQQYLHKYDKNSL